MKFKEGVDPKDFESLHPVLIYLIAQVNLYAIVHNLDFVITSIITDRIEGTGKTNTHSEGRAIDFRLRGWSEFHIRRIKNKLTEEYSDLGAISLNSGEPNVLVVESDHFHLQVRHDAPIMQVLAIN